MVQLYKIVDEKQVYLDPSGGKVSHFISYTSAHNPFLNLIQYNLANEEDMDKDRIVLRHELSLLYLCMSHCGTFYTSDFLNRDCVFVWSLVDENEEYDTVLIKKRFNDQLENVDFEQGSVVFLNNAELLSVTVDTNKTYELTPLVDVTNGELCSGDTEIEYALKEEEKPLSAAVNLPILLICCTVVIVSVGAVFGFGAYLHHKKRPLLKV